MNSKVIVWANIWRLCVENKTFIVAKVNLTGRQEKRRHVLNRSPWSEICALHRLQGVSSNFDVNLVNLQLWQARPLLGQWRYFASTSRSFWKTGLKSSSRILGLPLFGDRVLTSKMELSLYLGQAKDQNIEGPTKAKMICISWTWFWIVAAAKVMMFNFHGASTPVTRV